MPILSIVVLRPVASRNDYNVDGLLLEAKFCFSFRRNVEDVPCSQIKLVQARQMRIPGQITLT